jgi:hypothetical protein
MNYFKTWEKLKLTFEKDSGRKKPGDTFMGVFRKPSGLEEATKKLDDAIKRADEASLEKAEKEFVLKKTNYLKVLEKSMNEEKETAIKADLNKLKIGLNAIHEDFKEAKVNALSGTVTKDMQALNSELGKVCLTLKNALSELEGYVKGLDRVKAKLEWGAGTKNSKEFKSAVDLHKKSTETFAKTAKGASDLSSKTAKRVSDCEKSWRSSGFIKGPNANSTVNQLWESITASHDDATQVADSIKAVIRDGEKGNKEVTTLQANLAKALKS